MWKVVIAVDHANYKGCTIYQKFYTRIYETHESKWVPLNKTPQITNWKPALETPTRIVNQKS